jgi:hypothetical protein
MTQRPLSSPSHYPPTHTHTIYELPTVTRSSRPTEHKGAARDRMLTISLIVSFFFFFFLLLFCFTVTGGQSGRCSPKPTLKCSSLSTPQSFSFSPRLRSPTLRRSSRIPCAFVLPSTHPSYVYLFLFVSVSDRASDHVFPTFSLHFLKISSHATLTHACYYDNAHDAPPPSSWCMTIPARQEFL